MFGRKAMVFVPTLLVLAISACSAGASSTPTAAPATASVAPSGTPHNNAIPQSIQGNYKASIAHSTVSAGDWVISIMANDILATNPHPGSEPFAVGVIDVSGDRITFRADAECNPGAPDKEGVYTYTLQGSELHFSAVDDRCPDRKAMLTAAAWQRQP